MGSYVKVFLTLTPSRILPFTQIDLLYFLQIPGFPGGSNIRVCLQCRRPGFSPGLGRSPGEENGYLLQYSCLENPMDRGACGLQSMGSQRVRHFHFYWTWLTSLSWVVFSPPFCMSNYKFLSKSILMSHMIYEAFSKCPNPDSHDLLQKWQMYLHWCVDNLAMLLSRLFFKSQNGPSFSLCKCSYFESWGFILHNSSCPLTSSQIHAILNLKGSFSFNALSLK